MWLLREGSCRFAQLCGLLMIINGGDYGLQLWRRLQSASAGESFTPAEWAKSIVQCTGLLIGGGVLIVFVQVMLRFWYDLDKRMAAHPNEPWLWRKDWAEKHIRLATRPAAYALAIAWLTYLLVFWPVAVMAAAKNPYFAYPFIVVLGMALVHFSKNLWRGRRWFTAEMRLRDVPGRIGQSIAGDIVLKESFDAGTRFRVLLKCQRTSRTGSSDLRPVDIAWSTQLFLTANAENMPGKTIVPFEFEIPADCTPTSTSSHTSREGWTKVVETRTHHDWFIEISLRDDRLQTAAKFEVPVFRGKKRTKASSESSPSQAE